ncbi:CPBP family intramembrane metalloprotease [Opitutaceae bacterium]|nr:CPBP family intramembrane metalloprotease [Opitutaceae bacterium]
MLLPILIATAWSFHGQDTRMLPDILASMILYSVIAGYGWVWRADWIHLLRPPAKITTPLVIMVVLIPVVSVAIAVGMTFAANALSLDIMEITPALLDAEWSIPMCFVWIAVLPPVMEEIAFRGIMLSRLQSVMSPRNVVWLTSILFGLLHFDILAMAFLLVPLAVAAAYLTRLSGSLYPAILVHAAHNTAIVALELGMRY